MTIITTKAKLLPGEEVQTTLPKIEQGIPKPVWFHHHGHKLNIVPAEFDRASTVKLESNAVEIIITTTQQPGSFWIRWLLRHTTGRAQGQIYLDARELSSAFGLSNQTIGDGEWLCKRYLSECAAQGIFIRAGRYLSIPGPGTGHDGDPNVSIYLTDEIRQAIQQIIDRHR